MINKDSKIIDLILGKILIVEEVKIIILKVILILIVKELIKAISLGVNKILMKEVEED